jgi:3',5'-cyclic AMP phosphodiesterase CpdA
MTDATGALLAPPRTAAATRRSRPKAAFRRVLKGIPDGRKRVLVIGSPTGNMNLGLRFWTPIFLESDSITRLFEAVRPETQGPTQGPETFGWGFVVGSHLLVQISDVHLTTDGSLPPGVRPRDNLIAGLRLLEEAGIRPDVFLLTGDLADDGDGDCYDDLAGILAGAASQGDASVIYLPGNHDDRDMFRRRLLGGDGAGPVNQTHWREGLRIVALDSTVPGEDGGALAEETLGYLRSELGSPAPDGTVVALHHPPLRSPIQPMSRMGLRDPERLRDAIAGSDVRLVLCGHNHHEALGTIGTVPVWVSPACAYRLDTASTQAFRGVPGSAFSRIDLSEDGPTVTVIPVP